MTSAASPAITIRPIEPGGYEAFSTVLHVAFGQTQNAEGLEHERELIEFGRTLAAFDGDDIVGTAAAYSFEMTVPGRTVPTAGVTWVSVLPTHRRRGLLRQLMRRQLDDIHEAGREPLAALWASEAPIYGRFGYGCASTVYAMTVPRRGIAMHQVPGVEELRIRLVEGADHLDDTARVYDHDRARRPGMMARHGAWGRQGLFWPESSRRGASELRTALAVDDMGDVRAYARYATRPGPDFGEATTLVREMHAVDGAAASALLAYVLDLDLTAATSVALRPGDDPITSLLVDPRLPKPQTSDGLHVRLVDLQAALAARTYAVAVDVVLDVHDVTCPWNTGRWRLAGDPTGATCEPTTSEPDLRLGVRELGAVYLGGTSLVALAGAGLVQERTAGAVAELSLALRHDPAPWSPFIF